MSTGNNILKAFLFLVFFNLLAALIKARKIVFEILWKYINSGQNNSALVAVVPILLLYTQMSEFGRGLISGALLRPDNDPGAGG